MYLVPSVNRSALSSVCSVCRSSSRSAVSALRGGRAAVRGRLYLPLILDQQAQVMLPADRRRRPQIKAVCSDSRKCQGCQTQVCVISLSLPWFFFFLYLATLSAGVISPPQITMTTLSVKSACSFSALRSAICFDRVAVCDTSDEGFVIACDEQTLGGKETDS